MLPLSCAIYRVKCMYCKITIGHVIIDPETSMEGAVNRACATFDTDQVHNASCAYTREGYNQNNIKKKSFVVELI